LDTDATDPCPRTPEIIFDLKIIEIMVNGLPGRLERSWQDGFVFQFGGVTGMTVQAVFFDMGGTIETFGWTPEYRLQETAGIRQRLVQAGIVLDLTDRQLHEIISAGLDAYHQVSLQTMDEMPPERVWNEYVLPGYPLDRKKLSAIAEELMCFIETHWFQRAMRPEVPGVLQAIHKMGLKIGLISNVNSRGQVPTNLELYGIHHYFDPIVLSSEYGRRKPDPAIFHYAARLANVPTSECLYIGDRIARDVVGARKAGFHLAVQIINEFDHGEVDNGAEPDAVITKMTELLDILKEELDQSKSTSLRSIQPSGQVRALLFDAGDILYFRPERDQKFQAFLNALGLADKEIPDAARNALKGQAYHGSITQDQFREAVLNLYGVNDPEQIVCGKLAMEEDDNNIRFFEGVRETLTSLKDKGFLLGIITDTAMPLHVKLKWFENGGFVHVWDSIISSQELGIQKPAPEIYAAALQQLGLSADQAAFVGHDVDELQGARTSGMKIIAFNNGESAKADFYIKTFSDLLKIPIISGSLRIPMARE
jgi:putative hydrolase of the HAD superfamily